MFSTRFRRSVVDTKMIENDSDLTRHYNRGCAHFRDPLYKIFLPANMEICLKIRLSHIYFGKKKGRRKKHVVGSVIILFTFHFTQARAAAPWLVGGWHSSCCNTSVGLVHPTLLLCVYSQSLGVFQMWKESNICPYWLSLKSFVA